MTGVSSRTLGWMAGVVGAVALLGGGFAGVRLGQAASQPRVEEVRVVDPGALSGVPGLEVRSPAGFTGFGGPPALEGEVLRKGVAAEAGSGSFTLVDGGARSQIDFSQPLRLYRVTPSTAPLALGDSVVVRFEGGRATGVLRVRGAPQGTGPPSR
jgi:hypothetical protein